MGGAMLLYTVKTLGVAAPTTSPTQAVRRHTMMCALAVASTKHALQVT